jgi:type III pantothenate kinase
MFPDNNVLIIQTGTCITYEFVSGEGEYSGGSISPGIDMRLKSMNTFTAKLPLVKKQEIDYLIGKTTKESILSGVINGCIAEIDGIIDQYRKKFSELKVVAGGGDIFFFDKKLKNRIFATENLVLKGLNEILKFNNAKL